MKYMAAHVLPEHCRHIRRRAIGENQLARLISETVTLDPETTELAVFEDRFDGLDGVVVTHIVLEFPGYPGHVIRPFKTAGRAPQQTELEQAILFLEVHGKAVRALRVTRGYQVPIDVMVDIGVAEQQVRMPSAACGLFQRQKTTPAGAALRREFFIVNASKCQACRTKADTQRIDVVGGRRRMVHFMILD
ncbi:hypothetical protein D3C84_707910 [compost metagenome]